MSTESQISIPILKVDQSFNHLVLEIILSTLHSPMGLYGLHEDSAEIIHGLLMDSLWTPKGLPLLFIELK